jgi:hypothetical protein
MTYGVPSFFLSLHKHPLVANEFLSLQDLLYTPIAANVERSQVAYL